MCVRVYAVTQRNTWIASALSVIMAAQLGFGIYLIVDAARTPCKFPNRSLVRVEIYNRPLVLPSFGINLDAFHTCSFQQWRVGDLAFGYITIFFGTSSLSNLQHGFTLGVLTRLTHYPPNSRHRRYCCILGHFNHSQETRGAQISRNHKPLGWYSPGRDNQLYSRVCL
jgi:hypothetical protein